MHCIQPDGEAQRYLARYREILDEMIRGMTGAALGDSISANFIAQMIPHHEAAIEMSRNVLAYTDLVPLRRIAENIVDEQTKSIADMRNAQAACAARENNPCRRQDYLAVFARITQTMFGRMCTAPATDRINADFLREMIPHHEGAIAMSENALRFPLCPELKPILESIIVSQERGVRNMRQLLRCIRA